MWKEMLHQITKIQNSYGDSINQGADESEIQIFKDFVTKKLNVTIPEEYIALLQKVNGLEFNGFILYGIDEEILVRKPDQHINGFVDNNLVWYENEWQKVYLFLGESSIDWYVYEMESKKYYTLDNPSGEEMREYSNLDDLLEDILKTALM